MSLLTGKRFTGFQWEELAIPQWVVEKVEELADQDGISELEEEGCSVFQIDMDVPLPNNFSI